MSRVCFEGVTKRFGDVVAVDDLRLEVADREFLVLVGPSGCGKTTVLRLVAGLDEPDAGLIHIGDRLVNGVEPKDRDVAMVFQSYALYPHMTVRRNMEFPLRTRRVPKEERARLVGEAAETLGLVDLLGRRPSQLSGGQRQRVALGRAIVRRPAVFLMDEPLSNLDAKLRAQTRAELIELHRRLQTTVLYVTHDQVEAMTMGSRIAVMDRGALQQVGRPQEVYERPANVFVAQFIGSPPTNLVRGSVEREGETLVVRVPGGVVPLTPDRAAVVSERSLAEVLVGVRPEHLAVDAGPVAATVRVVVSLGHERQGVFALDDGQLVVARMATDGPGLREGARVQLMARPEHVHLFDPATGTRLG